MSPAWNVLGRVHFNLVENSKGEQSPFAFLATYLTIAMERETGDWGHH